MDKKKVSHIKDLIGIEMMVGTIMMKIVKRILPHHHHRSALLYNLAILPFHLTG